MPDYNRFNGFNLSLSTAASEYQHKIGRGKKINKIKNEHEKSKRNIPNPFFVSFLKRKTIEIQLRIDERKKSIWKTNSRIPKKE